MTEREYNERDGDNADRELICRRCDMAESECVCSFFDEVVDEMFDEIE